jgi:hypothetical protein
MRLTACRRALLFTTALTASVLVLAPSALGAIDLGPGSEQPALAYETTTQTTYVAWQGFDLHSVDLCILPAGAIGCSGGAAYVLKDGPAEAGGLEPIYSTPQIVVEPAGGVVVVANLDGVNEAVKPSSKYTAVGVAAWVSAAGGGAFASGAQGLADGGDLLAPDIGDGDPPDAGAVALGGSDEVGVFGDSYPFGNSFAAFNPTTPAPATTPKPEPGGELYAENLYVDGGQIAALLNTPKANEDLVVTVGNAYTSLGGDPACPTSEHNTGYGVANTTVAKLNEQHSWEVGGPYFKPIACAAEAAVVAGGASGIGVFEDEGPGLEGSGPDSVDYRPFDPSTKSFGAPVEVSDETNLTLSGADDLSLSQDAGGGIYAMWSDSRNLELSYSDTAGASWQTPVTALGGEASDPIVAGVGSGNAEVAYTASTDDGSQEYLQPLNYAQLLAAQQTPPANTTTTPTNTMVTSPPATIITPTPSPTITQTVTVEGDDVSLSAPNQCVRNGIVKGVAQVTVPSAHRKGKYVVKIYEAIFKVDGKTLTIKRKHLSPAPFKVKIHLKHVKPGTKLVLTAHLLIAVHHGPKRSKTLRVTLTTCA